MLPRSEGHVDSTRAQRPGRTSRIQMVSGLDSAREQLQWRLTYAAKNSHIGVRAFADCVYQFTQRSVSSLRTKAHATAYAQSVGPYSQAGASEGESIFTQTGDAGQHAHRGLDSKAAGLPHDRRRNRGRWSNFIRQTRTRVAHRPDARA